MKIPRIQQQNNNCDCGLFAIANMIDFVSNRYQGLQDGKLELVYVQSEIGKYLKKCLGQKYMEPFQNENLQWQNML